MNRRLSILIAVIVAILLLAVWRHGNSKAPQAKEQPVVEIKGSPTPVVGIWPQKEGYLYDLKLPSRRPDNYQADPNNPVVFTMWKIRGAEPIIHTKFQSTVP